MIEDFLNFYCQSNSIGLSVLSEFFLFFANKKEIIRLSLNKGDFNQTKIICEKHNLEYKYTSFATYNYGNGWTSLVENNSSNQINDTDTIVIVIGKSSKILIEYINAESQFDYIRAGELLGYPSCCIKAYKDIEILKENWFQYYLSDNRKKYPLWANRINTIFGGGSFIGEMFPCSLHCKKAIKLGKEAANTMNASGLVKLTEIIKSHCKAPLYLDENNQLSKAITLNKIEFY